ncbi:MAG: ABC transporter substrate-binding protein [Pseudomonadota bacterium]
MPFKTSIAPFRRWDVHAIALRSVLAAAVLAWLSALPASGQERIVSLGGDVTEILYGLGEGDRIVATDSTSVFPEAAQSMPKVGYVRQLSAEGVLSVEPDLILISGAAGPDTALDQIKASGVEIVQMETRYTIEAIVDKTRQVATAVGAPEAGEVLAGQISADWEAASEQIAALDLAPTVLFFATLGDGAPRAAGRDTAAHGIIELMGGSNPFDEQIGYKALSLEAAVAADPDVVLIMSHHAARIGEVEDVLAHPALALTRAAQSGMVILVDPVTVMQFSPRTPAALGDLAAEISERLNEAYGG